MPQRTTLVPNSDQRQAAERLAAHWGVTLSEAIRRALMRVACEELQQQREGKRRQRLAALEHLIELSSGQQLDSELQHIGEERDAW